MDSITITDDMQAALDRIEHLKGKYYSEPPALADGATDLSVWFSMARNAAWQRLIGKAYTAAADTASSLDGWPYTVRGAFDDAATHCNRDYYEWSEHAKAQARLVTSKAAR